MPPASHFILSVADQNRSTAFYSAVLVVPEAEGYHFRAIAAGAKELSRMQVRSWGHVAAYSLDPDGHVLAFAALAQQATSAA